MEALSITERNPFAASTTKFEERGKELGDEELLGVEHGDIETLLEERGRELLRVLAQDHLLTTIFGASEAPGGAA